MHESIVLAFDFGTRRIGVAVGEMMLGSARPLTTISAEANDVRFTAIGKLVAEWQPAALVVGLPLSLDGEPGDMTARCKRFARQLEGRFRLPVTLVDERWAVVLLPVYFIGILLWSILAVAWIERATPEK